MDIIIENGINILDNIKKVRAAGHVLCAYRECDKVFADREIGNIAQGYKVTTKTFPTNIDITTDAVSDMMEVSDDVRMIVVFGGSNLIEIAKEASTMMGIPLVIVLTTPTRILQEEGCIFNLSEFKRRKMVTPSLLLIDARILVQNGYFGHLIGDVAESLVLSFNGVFSDIVSGKGFRNLDTFNNLVSHLSTLNENDRMDVLGKCYDINMKKGGIVTIISEIMAYNSSGIIDKHNLKFVLTYTILLLYKAYLSYSDDDLLYPADIIESIKRINRLFGMDITDMVIGYRAINGEELMRLNHVICEYRSELLFILDRAIEVMGKLSKVYRRLLKDAGYAMYDKMSLDSMLETISLVSVLDEDRTLLKIMKTDGFLERYISDYKVS